MNNRIQNLIASYEAQFIVIQTYQLWLSFGPFLGCLKPRETPAIHCYTNLHRQSALGIKVRLGVAAH